MKRCALIAALLVNVLDARCRPRGGTRPMSVKGGTAQQQLESPEPPVKGQDIQEGGSGFPVCSPENFFAKLKKNNPELSDISDDLLGTYGNIPTGFWLTSDESLDRLQAGIGSCGNKPAHLVLYNIPNRDCEHGYSAGSQDMGLDEYKTFVQKAVDAIGGKPAWMMVEPDAIGLMDNCGEGAKANHIEALKSAVDILGAHSNIVCYLDVGYWVLSADDQEKNKKIVDILEQVDPNRVCKGIALNTSNYRETKEMEGLIEGLNQVSGDRKITAIIDTSRNGQGPLSKDAWCNPAGRGMGALPTTDTCNEMVDAFLWNKVPGESDGTCNGGPAAGMVFPDQCRELYELRDFSSCQ